MKKNKVFIIGLHKTGTTSLAYFFKKLGYLVTGPDTHLVAQIEKNNFREVNRFLDAYDVFQDDPWYMIYPYLYRKFPRAKFILLERNESDWIKSVQSFYGVDRYNNAVRRKFYGSANTLKYEKEYLHKYRSHTNEVKEFFKNNDNFISISIANDDDAVKLQQFLNLRLQFTSFPHKNKTPKTNKELKRRRVKNKIKDGFGLKRFIKKNLKKRLGYKNYIQLRTTIRYYRTKARRFLVKLFK